MTPPADKKTAPVIHAARVWDLHGRTQLLLLRKKEPQLFVWMEEKENGQEQETSVTSSHIEEVIRIAARHWKNVGFKTLNCGSI